MRFGEKLQALRQSAGLSQPALAKASGLPVGSIRNYEQGHREPLWDVVFKLAKALGVDCRAFAECVQAEPAASLPTAHKRVAGGKRERLETRPGGVAEVRNTPRRKTK